MIEYMTDDEMQLEKEYRIKERIGMMCEDNPPTPQQSRIAIEEARNWVAVYHYDMSGIDFPHDF